MVKWEYKTKYNEFRLSDKALDEFGQDGWELVSLTQDVLYKTWSYVFKRPIREADPRNFTGLR